MNTSLAKIFFIISLVHLKNNIYICDHLDLKITLFICLKKVSKMMIKVGMISKLLSNRVSSC